MAADRYILPAYDEDGQLQEVELDTIGSGYTGLAVFDETGAEHEIASDPASSPPTGELPVIDENGTQHLIAFQLAGIDGIYELSANALNAEMELALRAEVGTLNVPAPLLTYRYVAFENAAFTSPTTTAGGYWAETRIEWGSHEQIGFGGQSNRYRLRGDAYLTVYVPLGIGLGVLLEACEGIAQRLRHQSMDLVSTFDASYRPIERDGAYWAAEVRVEFWAEREYAVPTPVAYSAQTLSTWHDVIRARVDDYATAQGLEVAWDNAPFTETDGEMFIACRIVDGPIRSVEVGPTLRRRCSGKAVVEFRAPIGTGTRDVLRAVDALALEFRAASDSGVRFGVPSARTVGRSGRHWLVIVDVPYRVDEIA